MNTVSIGQVKTVVSHDPEEASRWDQFLTQLPGAHVEQSVAWGRLKHTYGWKPTWLWVERDNQIIGGAMLLTRPVRSFASIGYVERGPAWDPQVTGALDAVMEALADLVRSMHLTYFVVAPPYCGDPVIPLLESKRFRIK